MHSKNTIKQGLHYRFATQEHILKNKLTIVNTDSYTEFSYYFSPTDCSFFAGESQSQHQLTFYFESIFFESHSLKSEINFKEYEEHDLCCKTQLILHEFANSKLIGALQLLFIESKALELLLCALHCKETVTKDCTNCKFLNNPFEKEKIHNAKHILLSRLENPPTIPELAKLLGMNQCYLKKGFKEIYASTIYDFVQSQRMLKAKLLLTTSSETIANIAELVGFSNASNFSNAFKKQVGVHPSELQKLNDRNSVLN